MNKQEEKFHSIGSAFPAAEASQLFGKPCYKTGGKAFICFFRDEMVCKLRGDIHDAALKETGAKLFDPSGKNRPMKEWVQLPETAAWAKYASAAYQAAAAAKV